MKLKNCATLILLCLICIPMAYAQPSTFPAKSYISIEPAGLPGSQIREACQGKVCMLLSSGGYIMMRPTATALRSAGRLRFQVVNTESDSPLSPTEPLPIAKLHRDPVYLYPGSGYVINILDDKSSTLICRYVINRPKLIPVVQFYHAMMEDKKPFYTLTASSQAEQLSMSPGKIDLGLAERSDFKGLDVEYTLINQKTRKRQSGISKTGFHSLDLDANTVYELRLNYVTQKESVLVSYLYVKPYWYQASKTYLILAMILITIAAGLTVMVFKNKAGRSQKQQQKLEEAAIRLQSLLNPHFTFNALSTIQGLINTDRIEEANDYLEEFSALLRKTLSNSRNVFNSLDQELEMMRIYLRLESLRFNFSWNIEFPEDLDSSVIEIPTLLLQPIIENAIKHGISELGDKGLIQIICKETPEENSFVIKVKDNGKWQDKNPVLGYGLSLTTDRIKTINQLMKDKSIILHLNKESGTEVALTFHNWLIN